MSVISVRDLSKIYKVGEHSIHALRSISLEVDPGEFLAVIGPSGSGKSTLMHILGCLDQPTGGQYFLDGKDVSHLSDDEISLVRNKKIGFVFQGFNLLSRTSALENVELPLLYGGTNISASERKDRAMAALTAVGLESRADHHSNQLSGGQQQRVAIARALLNSPSILLADEPTGNLDSKTSVEVMEIFQSLQRERGITIVLITHEMDVAKYGSRIVSFKDGNIISDTSNDSRRHAGGELEDLADEDQTERVA
jgi:putative ABC transport system ATP-binding protein